MDRQIICKTPHPDTVGVEQIPYLAIQTYEPGERVEYLILDFEELRGGLWHQSWLDQTVKPYCNTILYAATESVNWQDLDPRIQELLDNAENLWFAVVSHSQGRWATRTHGGRYWIHNHWEYSTWYTCNHWLRIDPGQPTHDYLWLGRRVAPERLWIYYQLCQLPDTGLRSQGWRNYWGGDDPEHTDGGVYHKWLEQSSRWYRDYPRAVKWFRQLYKRRAKSWEDYLEKLPNWIEPNYVTGEPDIYDSNTSLLRAYRSVRVSLVSDSHPDQPHGHVMHTEKLWRSIIAADQTLALGQPGYYQSLAELGYPVDVPYWDTDDDLYSRLQGFLQDYENRTERIDTVGCRAWYSHRMAHNPLPVELIHLSRYQ